MSIVRMRSLLRRFISLTSCVVSRKERICFSVPPDNDFNPSSMVLKELILSCIRYLFTYLSKCIRIFVCA